MDKINAQKSIALNVVKILQENGYIAFLAGGCVRDELLGRKPKDYDVATDAYPEEVESLFPRTIPIGKAFGVIAVVDGAETVEVATFREDVGTLDGRHPETIRFSAAKEDALRRDFTINGMFYDPVKDQLHDYVQGKRDLEKKIITAIGNPEERFGEDHLRMLRAIRFTHNLGFDLDPETERAVSKMAKLISNISAERIEAELSRTLTDSLKPGDALKHLHKVGLLEYILPEILPMIGQEQPPQFHPEGDVFEHTCLMLNLMNEGQTGKSAPQVEQTFQSAHPEEEFAQNPFRPVEQTENLHQSRRRLPHWNQTSRIYFVTFRLADSIAKEKLDQWKEELELWRSNQPNPDSDEAISKPSRRYQKKQQEWLDQGHGECLLQQPNLSEIVEQSLLHFDGERYRLGDYVIMPNHVHVLVEPINQHSLPEIMKSWKGFSAHEINKTIGRKGSIWMDESFDHIVRRVYFFNKFSDYIKENPVRARFSAEKYRLGQGSLRLAVLAEGQTGKSAPHVEQTFQSAHSEEKPSYTPRELVYAILLHDIGKPSTASIGPGADGEPRIRFDGHAQISANMAEKILSRLKFSKKEKKHIVDAIRGHMRFMDVQNMKTSTLRKMIGAELFDLEMELHRIDCLGSHAKLDNYDFIRDYQNKLAHEPILPEPWIGGHNLMEMGIEEGRLIGKILKEAYNAQIEGRFASPEELITWIKETYLS